MYRARTINLRGEEEVMVVSFETREGSTIIVGNIHQVKFTPNIGNPVRNFLFLEDGHMEFDYGGKHYFHEVGSLTTVTLGAEAIFTDVA